MVKIQNREAFSRGRKREIPWFQNSMKNKECIGCLTDMFKYAKLWVFFQKLKPINMKKTFFAFIAIATILLTSCASNSENGSVDTYTTEVAVVHEAVQPSTHAGSAWYKKHLVYDAITKSGDTIKVRVTEKVKFENKLPYKAVVEKRSLYAFATVQQILPETKDSTLATN